MSWSNDDIRYYFGYYESALQTPPNLFMSMAMKESSYDPNTGFFRNVRNSIGATGLMQLRPNAIADIKRAFNVDIDPLDPVWSIYGTALLFVLNQRYIKSSIGEMPSWAALVVAYNGGWTAGKYYMQNGAAPSNEGRNYLAFVNELSGYFA